METTSPSRIEDHPKKRRRRRRPQQRLPLSAKLLFDEQAKGDTGILSTDLYNHLFPSSSSNDDDDDDNNVRYVALTLWSPPSPTTVEDASWTIVPTRKQAGEASAPKLSSLFFSSKSRALQGLASAAQAGPQFMISKAGLEVLVIDVQPMPLETVYIKLNGDALRKHEDVQAKFGGGFVSSVRNAKAKGKQ